MSEIILLDTNIVSAALRGKDGVDEKIRAEPIIALPFIVIAELRYGAFHAEHTVSQTSKVEEFIRRFPIVYADDLTTELFGRHKTTLRMDGKMIPDHDIWIAALTLKYHGILITRDEHFNRIKDLRVERW